MSLSAKFADSDVHFHNDEKDDKKFSLDITLIFNKRSFVILCFLIVSLCLPFLLYLDVFDEAKLPSKLQGICLVDNSYRIPCGITNATEADCYEILCCFEKKTNSCYHQEPSSYFYYQKNKDSNFYIPSQDKTPLGLPSMKQISMNYLEDGDILKIYLNDTRGLLKSMKSGFDNFDILNNENKKLSISVYRKNTTEMLLTTLKGPLIVNEDYLEWTIQLTNGSGVLFGMGELQIKSNTNSTVSKIIYKNQDDHNTLPMFMAYSNGKYHAAVISHEGALQVTVLPSYLLHLRALYAGSIQIKIIDGPTPKDIYNKIKYQTEKPASFPEWVHGVHICREEPAGTIGDLKDQYTCFISHKNEFPDFTYESDCVHDDLLLHLMYRNYTPQQTFYFLDSLGMQEKFVLSYPPQIPLYSNIFQKFKKSGIFYKNTSDGSLFVGKYKKFDVVYPMYSLKDSIELIQEVLELFQRVKIDGITFTNSWPQDDRYQMENSTDPFVDTEIQNAFSHTIPWNIRRGQDIHARHHNNYGSTFAQAVAKQASVEVTFSAVSDTNSNDPLIVQNVNTSWSNLKTSLRTTLFNSLFGRNFLAIPVCGTNFYDQKEQEDLCLRWYLVAATMPLLRVSARGLQRSPINLFTKYTIQKVISILDTRRTLQPYYRALLKEGGPLIRPMFYNFPQDEKVHSLDEQYMVGDGLLVAQPMSPDIELMKIYLPPNMAWYEIWGGQMYNTKRDKEWITLPIVKSDWVSFILEGHIIPLVKETNNGLEISLKIAMNCKHDPCEAKGSLVYEQFGDVLITFNATGDNFTVSPSQINKKDVKDMITSVCWYNYTSNACSSFSNKEALLIYYAYIFLLQMSSFLDEDFN